MIVDGACALPMQITSKSEEGIRFEVRAERKRDLLNRIEYRIG